MLSGYQPQNDLIVIAASITERLPIRLKMSTSSEVTYAISALPAYYHLLEELIVRD
jgi:hypothetical protein